MVATQSVAARSVPALARRIRALAGPDGGLARRYAAAQARRLLRAPGELTPAAVAASAARVREAVRHAALAAAARRSPAATVRLWEEVRGESMGAAAGFARVLASGLGLTADDLAQEGFLKLVAAAQAFDPRRATFRTYFRRVVRHHVLDLARKARARPAAGSLGDAVVEPADTRHPDPADAAAGGAWSRAVGEAVADVCAGLGAELGADRLAAFRLRRLGGRKLAEVAGETGRCVAWVYRADLAVARAFADRFRGRYPDLARDVRE